MIKNNGKIIVKLQGGLGNQLFQYAYGLALSNLFSKDYCLDTSLLEISRSGVTQRNYDLTPYPISARKLDRIESMRLGIIQNPQIVKVLSKLKISFKGYKYITESILPQDDLNCIATDGSLVLGGYWQSEKYFKNVSDILRRQVLSYKVNSELALNMFNKIDNSESVGIHIRRGDYISNPSAMKVHGICNVEYYEDAIEHILENVSKPTFFVFTDDPEWARINLLHKYELTIVSGTGELTHHDELNLMAHCRHNIIANSSFSWWAAWLNSNSNKVIVAPKLWYRVKDTPPDLIPIKWHII